MKYQIYNPTTVSFEEFEDLSLAIARRDELRAGVADMFPHNVYIPAECCMLADWQIADAFFSEKTGVDAIDFSDATRLALGGLDHPCYTHSVFNLTTQEPWSRTFMYCVDDKLYHIKVREGAVTDWYQYKYILDGVEYDWVAFDLVSGEPIEYYVISSPIMTKYDAKTGAPTAEWVMGVVPPEDFLSRVPSSIDTVKIFAYSTKTYGDIIEYKEDVSVADIDSDIYPAIQHRLLLIENSVNAQRALTAEQIVVLQVEQNEDGTTSITNIDATL